MTVNDLIPGHKYHIHKDYEVEYEFIGIFQKINKPDTWCALFKLPEKVTRFTIASSNKYDGVPEGILNVIPFLTNFTPHIFEQV